MAPLPQHCQQVVTQRFHEKMSLYHRKITKIYFVNSIAFGPKGKHKTHSCCRQFYCAWQKTNSIEKENF